MACSEFANQFISACSSKPCHLRKPTAQLAAVQVGVELWAHGGQWVSLRALKLGGERARALRTTGKQSWGDSHVHIWCCSGRFLMYSVTREGLLPATTFRVKCMLFPLSFHAVNVLLAQMKSTVGNVLPQPGSCWLQGNHIAEPWGQARAGVCAYFSSDLETEIILSWSICIFLTHWCCEREFFTLKGHYFLGRMIRSLLSCLPSNFLCMWCPNCGRRLPIYQFYSFISVPPLSLGVHKMKHVTGHWINMVSKRCLCLINNQV